MYLPVQAKQDVHELLELFGRGKYIDWIYGEGETSATLPVKKLHVYSSLSLFEKTLLLSFKVCAFLKQNAQTLILVFQHLAKSYFN